MASLSDEDREKFSAYLDGELDEGATQELEARLAQDPVMRKELDTMRQAWNMLDYLPKAEASPNFTNRTLEKLSLQEISRSTGKVPVAAPRPTWTLGLTWLLAVTAALLVGAGGGMVLWPASRDGRDREGPLLHHLRAIEKIRLYENIEDADFLRSLNSPEFFGDDAPNF